MINGRDDLRRGRKMGKDRGRGRDRLIWTMPGRQMKGFQLWVQIAKSNRRNRKADAVVDVGN